MPNNKYYIIEQTEEGGANTVEEFDTLEECREFFKFLTDPDCLNPYYEDLQKIGGYLRIEDENGGGY